MADGDVSPGGVGYDINCGVRLLAAPFSARELVRDARTSRTRSRGRSQRVPDAAASLRFAVAGSTACSRRDRALVHERGIGSEDDLERLEAGGRLPEARPDALSDRARERGADQLGSLGSGNHFVEVQRVAEVLDEPAAEAFGLREDLVTVLIHSGSRGLGHQVCTDFVKRMDQALGRHGIELPDRQFPAPIASEEGRAYLAAMAAAANFAWANRHAIAALVRSSIGRVVGAEQAHGTRLVYDVAHNVAKLEEHAGRRVCVHRKGATRAFRAGSESSHSTIETSATVVHPGQHGHDQLRARRSAGGMERSFGTVCHEAGLG